MLQNNKEEDRYKVITQINTIENLPPVKYAEGLKTLNSNLATLKNRTADMINRHAELIDNVESAYVKSFHHELLNESSTCSPKLNEQQLKSLPEVKDIFYDNGEHSPTTIAIVLKDKQLEKVYHNSDDENTIIPFIIPSYTIVYEPVWTKDNVHKFQTERLNRNADIVTYWEYKWSLYWTDWRKLRIMLNTYSAFTNDSDVNPNNIGNRISPYVGTFSSCQMSNEETITKLGKHSEMCYGANNIQQDDLLKKGEIFLHLKSTIDTLYHKDDPDNAGYSSWGAMLDSLLTLEKEQQIHDKFKNMDMHSQLIPEYNIQSKYAHLYPRHTMEIEFSAEKQKEIIDYCQEKGKELIENKEILVNPDGDHVNTLTPNEIEQIRTKIDDKEDPMNIDLQGIQIMKTLLLTDDKREVTITILLTELEDDDIDSIKIDSKEFSLAEFKSLIN